MVQSTRALVPLSERRSTGKKLQERRDGRQNFPNSVRNQVKFCSTPDTSCVRESRRRIIARQRQIEYGYNTIGYARYLQLVPRAARSMNATVHPRTPDPHLKCSKRSYDGQVKKWRRLLHRYDVSEGQHISCLSRAVNHMENEASRQTTLNGMFGLQNYAPSKQKSTICLALSRPPDHEIIADPWENYDNFFGLA